MNTTIPFSGFYETMWSNELDREEESLAEYLTGANDSGDGVGGFKGRSVSDVCEAMYWSIDYKAAFLEIAKGYADCFARELDQQCGWRVHFVFEELTSPREYNFTTNRIFMTLPRASVRRMRRECAAAILERMARERFTSRSGFISYYSGDVKTWGALESWDHNQIGTLLDAWMATRCIEIKDMEIFESMCGNNFFGDALDMAFDRDHCLSKLTEKEVA